MDLKAVGGVFEAVGYALPFAHAIDAARAALAGAILGVVAADVGWLAAYTVAFLVTGVLLF
jgi:ABC-2 type transport system permease protein